MGMPGRGMMFVGEKGVQVSAFYGGSPSLPDHTLARAGPEVSRTPRRLAPAGEPFQGLQAARAVPCRGARERIITPSGSRACKAGKKSITPIEFACDLHGIRLARNGDAAPVQHARARRHAPSRALRENPGGSGRSDSAVVWIPASNDGHVHVPDARPSGNNGTGAMYWRTSKVLLWDAKAGRFSNDEVANGYVDTPYRKEWDYKV